VIRETIREMKVAIGRVVLTNREHIIALEPLEKGLVGTHLRYPHEVRSEDEYFDEIQDVKVTKTYSISPSIIVKPEVRTVRAREVRCGGHTRRAAGRDGGRRQRSLASLPRFRAVAVSITRPGA
jgi:hypothetical protein